MLNYLDLLSICLKLSEQTEKSFRLKKFAKASNLHCSYAILMLSICSSNAILVLF